MSTDLTRIGEKAAKSPKLVFTSLYHHIADVDNLRESYAMIDGRKAVGKDGITKAAYGENLEENLRNLSERLKRMGYVPQPKRRSYIPKSGSKKKRPLGVSCFEDKLVEQSVKRALEPIYETMFEEHSYGYRPRRKHHQCLDKLGRTIQQRRVNYIVEADIRGFFDNVNHEWMMKFLQHRIGDPRVLRLISRMLKGGILEEGIVKASESGTPQGSILSPLLSNIYLHYVLDIWFTRRFRRYCRGENYIFRFADDFLACFQYEDEANKFMEMLKERLEGFHLQLAEEKTRLVKFGRWARVNARKAGRKPDEFDFLGFTFYCGKTRNGHFKVKRKTSRKKFQASLRAFTEWAKDVYRYMRKGEMLRRARARIQGHLNYYAITDNADKCNLFLHWTTRILFKWINRKSQRRAYVWEGFRHVMRTLKWPTLRIRISMCPFKKLDPEPNV